MTEGVRDTIVGADIISHIGEKDDFFEETVQEIESPVHCLEVTVVLCFYFKRIVDRMVLFFIIAKPSSRLYAEINTVISVNVLLACATVFDFTKSPMVS